MQSLKQDKTVLKTYFNLQYYFKLFLMTILNVFWKKENKQKRKQTGLKQAQKYIFNIFPTDFQSILTCLKSY